MPKRTRKGNGTNPITSHLLNREDKENKKGKERKMTSLCDPNWKKKERKGEEMLPTEASSNIMNEMLQ